MSDQGDLAIRPFLDADRAALQTIRARAFAPVFRSLRSLVSEDVAAIAYARAEAEQAQLLETLCSAADPATVLVAARGAAPIGFVAFTTDREARIGEIGLNAVDPEHAGQGVGTALYQRAIDAMRDAGVAVATVSTGDDESHAPARRAYAKIGFAPGGRSVWMTMKL